MDLFRPRVSSYKFWKNSLLLPTLFAVGHNAIAADEPITNRTINATIEFRVSTRKLFAILAGRKIGSLSFGLAIGAIV